MPMTDTDRLSTPNDMVDLLKRLTTIVRDVEALPENAQQRFWEDVDHSLQAIPPEDLRLDAAISMRSVHVLYSILSTICGPRLAEMVNGSVKEYYEGMMSQMKEASLSAWESFLDQKFNESPNGDGLLIASVELSSNNLGGGILRRVAGVPKLLKLVVADSKKERYFSSRDIIVMELGSRTPEA